MKYAQVVSLMKYYVLQIPKRRITTCFEEHIMPAAEGNTTCACCEVRAKRGIFTSWIFSPGSFCLPPATAIFQQQV